MGGSLGGGLGTSKSNDPFATTSNPLGSTDIFGGGGTGGLNFGGIGGATNPNAQYPTRVPTITSNPHNLPRAIPTATSDPDVGENAELQPLGLKHHSRVSLGARPLRSAISNSFLTQRGVSFDARKVLDRNVDVLKVLDSGRELQVVTVDQPIKRIILKQQPQISDKDAKLLSGTTPLEDIDDANLDAVEDFTVDHKYGRITWPGKTDVRDFKLDDILRFRDKQIDFYWDAQTRPERGTQLNKTALLTIKRIRPPEGYSEERLRRKLQKTNSRNPGQTFISYSNEEWTFQVEARDPEADPAAAAGHGA